MRVTYCVLELGDDSSVENSEIARLSNMKPEDVIVKNLSKCTAGNQKRFAIIADLYIWTSKYWYGTYSDKLTFVEFRGVEEVPVLFFIKYSDRIRLAITSGKLSIFDEKGMEVLREAEKASLSYFNEERISKIKPFICSLERYYSLLVVSKNPFA